MKNNISHKVLLLLLCCFVLNSCTETYILQTNTYQEALVVEATITNEFKKQEINITKTSRFEDKETKIETGAEVYITDNAGIRYEFEEQSGKYVSTSEFQAIPEREYQLTINTRDDKSYQSSTEIMSPINPMEDVKVAIESKDSKRGVAINVTNYNPNNNSKYYRYEYEETYKIITPNWSPLKAVVITDNGKPKIETVYNSPTTKVCYGVNKSTDIILKSTAELKEDLLNFPIRFISDQNYIISHRYSILVKQYIENLASYTFYKTLKKISETGSVLSPIQPGFLYGNIKSLGNTNEKVIGFFDVASFSSKRIYFNYSDLFPMEPLPPYYTECEEQLVDFCFGPLPCNGDALVAAFEMHTMTYSSHEGITYHIYPAPCGDCTTFSSNVKPSFWED